ncbi:sigma factor-like helix-turn-helix DNA-binding protein [Paenibacillus aquistagni]|uniref:sigma factor-like helix-turn-helix DNA-binding protein n=1 Tax=Paenibacillus aquistagni TaxID=1852522 RepID=UPI00145BB1FB|nr:sigma factor-like helix-turn-helix DNA-binding protein [Paenibacillus aquistagni]NMM52044.1 hypothetical protein [Paenibacillus aquistagni]
MVRKELLIYNAYRADREEILERLEQLDQDIQPRLSHMNGLPRGKGGLPRSSVEHAVINREETTQELNERLKQIETHMKPIELALDSLSFVERSVITALYHSLQHNTYTEIAESLGFTVNELMRIKREALVKFGCVYGGYWLQAIG